MKKILSLALAGVMMFSALPVAYAAEGEADYTAGTQVSYIGSREEAAGGSGEKYTITVPAKMTPGDTGTVSVTGLWSSAKMLYLAHDSSVTLTCGSDSFSATLSGGRMLLPGSNISYIEYEENISIADTFRSNDINFEKAYFGTWTGIIEYDVELVEITKAKGDANGDGVINDADSDYIQEVATDLVTLTDEEKAAVLSRADMDNNGVLSAYDSSQLLRILAGLDPIIPM